MNAELVSLLRANLDKPLSPELAADICIAASAMERLLEAGAPARVRPVNHENFVFALERIEDIGDEIRPLHRAHWEETEAHRHGLPFRPDYAAFAQYERAGRYVLLTARRGGRLLGNCAMYLDRSAHTQTLIATEDTLYLLPEARTRGMRSLGVAEINVTVKTVNKAGRFFQMLGYRHVENGLTKILEAEHVQLETAAS